MIGRFGRFQRAGRFVCFALTLFASCGEGPREFDQERAFGHLQAQVHGPRSRATRASATYDLWGALMQTTPTGDAHSFAGFAH